MSVVCPACKGRLQIVGAPIPSEGQTGRCTLCGCRFHVEPEGPATPVPGLETTGFRRFESEFEEIWGRIERREGSLPFDRAAAHPDETVRVGAGELEEASAAPAAVMRTAVEAAPAGAGADPELQASTAEASLDLDPSFRTPPSRGARSAPSGGTRGADPMHDFDPDLSFPSFRTPPPPPAAPTRVSSRLAPWKGLRAILPGAVPRPGPIELLLLGLAGLFLWAAASRGPIALVLALAAGLGLGAAAARCAERPQGAPRARPPWPGPVDLLRHALPAPAALLLALAPALVFWIGTRALLDASGPQEIPWRSAVLLLTAAPLAVLSVALVPAALVLASGPDRGRAINPWMAMRVVIEAPGRWARAGLVLLALGTAWFGAAFALSGIPVLGRPLASLAAGAFLFVVMRVLGSPGSVSSAAPSWSPR
jgi:hypothetical protein